MAGSNRAWAIARRDHLLGKGHGRNGRQVWIVWTNEQGRHKQSFHLPTLLWEREHGREWLGTSAAILASQRRDHVLTKGGTDRKPELIILWTDFDGVLHRQRFMEHRLLWEWENGPLRNDEQVHHKIGRRHLGSNASRNLRVTEGGHGAGQEVHDLHAELSHLEEVLLAQAELLAEYGLPDLLDLVAS